MIHVPQIIAIDFDNTLTLNQDFPEIGEPRTWLIEAAKRWKKEGHKLILWTCRGNVKEGDVSMFPVRDTLDEAVDWCKSHGLEFDAINQSLEELENPNYTFSRKVFANFYIDDSAVIFDDTMNILRMKGQDILPL